ncbi:tandem-95 repeat protein [Ramlibacter sp. AW1]|uniref:Tandem-95 repeat protein n=1 Tax=Ramlibacter aurantiacus TaxID=2801330 RepID=A0A936ZNB7_9BURK|nr:tandem-95 repeat protein [Ramlibacter aurantiacus]MBL0420468.1 tandem-95 repeat protein [Ramlibacter aurantiacus]
MGTSITRTLTPYEMQQLAAQLAAVRDAAGPPPQASNKPIFFAAFDGTNNDKDNLPLSGSPYPTNVARLYEQAQEARASNPNLRPYYYPGVGTGGENGSLIHAAIVPTAPILATAERAYANFSNWVQEQFLANPNTSPSDLTPVTAAFSRGTGTAFFFLQMVNDRGVTAADGTVLVKPGEVSAYSVSLDPVNTYVQGVEALPPIVIDNFAPQAIHETRTEFRGNDVANDLRTHGVWLPGNHVGIGGGYDQNGTAAAVLEMATASLQANGIPIADVPEHLRFDPNTPANLYTEAYQTTANGQVVHDAQEQPQPVLVWRVDAGPRRMVPFEAAVQTRAPTDPHSAFAVNGLDRQSDAVTLGGADPWGWQSSPHVTNPHSAYAVNGLDLQSDLQSDLHTASAGLQPPLPGGDGWLVAGLGDGWWAPSDGAGSIAQAWNPNPAAWPAQTFDSGLAIDAYSSQAVNGFDSQSDNFRAEFSVGLENVSPAFGAGSQGLGGGAPAMPSPVSTPAGDHVRFVAGDAGRITPVLHGNSTPQAASAIALASDALNALQSWVQHVNDQAASQGADASTRLALVAERLPGLAFIQGQVFIETRLNGLPQLQRVDSAAQLGPVLAQALQQQHAIAPAWAVETTRQQHAQGNAADLPDASSTTATGDHQFFEVLSTALPAHVLQRLGGAQRPDGEVALLSSQLQRPLAADERLMDVDGDGYLERSSWVAFGQAVLVIDTAGDGQLAGISDFLQLGTGLNGTSWLDASSNGLLDASDPAFAAVSLWVDVNGDGQSASGESLTLPQAGVSAIDWRHGQLLWADGTRSPLTVQRLDAEVAGQRLSAIRHLDPALQAGPIVEHEGAAGRGPRFGTHFAQRTGDWEGTPEAAAHRHGGEIAPNAPTLTEATGATSHGPVRALEEPALPAAQAQLETGNAGTAVAGQSGGQQQRAQVAADKLRPAPLAFVPATASSLAQAQREAAAALARASSEGMLVAAPLTALALGASAAASAAAATEGIPMDPAPTIGRPVGTGYTVHALSPEPPVVAPAASPVPSATQPVPPAPRAALEPAHPGTSRAEQGPPSALPQEVPQPEAPSGTSGPTAVQATRTAAPAGTPAAAADPAPPPLWEGRLPAGAEAPLGGPRAEADLLQAQEDEPLTLSEHALLANDMSDQGGGVHSGLQIVAVGQARGGEVQLLDTFDAQGQPVRSVRFVPDVNHHGPASFAYTVRDVNGMTRTSTAHVELAPVNDTPFAADDAFSTAEDQALVLQAWQLLANDSDADASTDPQVGTGDVLRIVQVGPARHGTVRLDEQGRVEFVPQPDFHGQASFRYEIEDLAGAHSWATANVSVSPVNDAPLARPDHLATQEDTPYFIAPQDLLANDSDVDASDDPHTGTGDVLRIAAVGEARHGSVRLDAAGQVEFVPAADFHGSASFTYWTQDQAGARVSATATVQVSPVNDAPIARGELLLAQEDERLLIAPEDLLANDSDIDASPDRRIGTGDVLRLAAVGEARHGNVRLDPQGWIDFEPQPDFHGDASFTYWVEDLAGARSAATVRVRLTPVNDAPVAGADRVTTAEDTPLFITPGHLLANDTDVDTPTDAQSLRIMATGDARHGEVRLMDDGTLRFMPDANFHGVASFVYEVGDGHGGSASAVVTIDVTPVNDAPVVPGQAATLDEDSIAIFAPGVLLAAATDVDSAHADLQLVAVDAAARGAVSLHADGTVRFQPVPDHNDENGPLAGFDILVADGAGGLTRARVDMHYTPVNDAPTVRGETARGLEDQPLVFTTAALLANDTDVDTPHANLRITQLLAPRHGSAAIDAEGRIVFTPTRDFAGTAGFDYLVADGQGGVGGGRVDLSIEPVNDAPTAQGEVVQGAVQNAVFHIPAHLLLANDPDVDDPAGALRVGWVGNPVHGGVALGASGQVVFTPAPGFSGSASFDYRVADAAGALSPVVTASVPVAPANRTPVAVDDRFATTRGSQMLIAADQLLGNDHDPDGDPLHLLAIGNAQGGSVTSNAGVVGFTPNAGFSGSASFDYTVGDGRGGITTATAFVDVLSPHRPPTVTQAIAFDFTSRDVPHAPVYLFQIEARSEDGASVYGTIESAPDTRFRFARTNKLVDFVYQDVGASNHYVKPFTLRFTDALGNSVVQQFWLDHRPYYGEVLSSAVIGTFVTPIAVDLDGDGLTYVSTTDSMVEFELHGNDLRHRLAWIAPRDGVLAWDRNGDHLVNGPAEFAFARYTPGATTDLEGLRAFDSNANSLLDAGDDEWRAFGIWQDGDDNGRSEAHEFRTLDEAGIQSIALQSNAQAQRVSEDVFVYGEAEVVMTDGSRRVAADAAFRAEAVNPRESGTAVAAIPQAERGTADTGEQAFMAELQRELLLWNQALNQVEPEPAPLGFIPLSAWQDDPLMDSGADEPPWPHAGVHPLHMAATA